MAEAFEPAGWAVSRFGHDNAIMLAELVPQAVKAAVVRQSDVHQVSKLETFHAYGGTWPARYDEFAKRLIAVPGSQVVKPHGRFFEIVLVNNIVVLPFEFAKDDTTRLEDHRVMANLNKLTQKLLELYGPAPEYVQPTIEGFSIDETAAEADQPELLPGFEPDGVVIVYYAANPYSGLFRIGWGEAEISIGNRPVWTPRKQELRLPVVKPLADASDKSATVLPAHGDQTQTRFDQGPIPTPIISARTKSERLNLDPVTAERPQEAPLAHDQE